MSLMGWKIEIVHISYWVYFVGWVARKFYILTRNYNMHDSQLDGRKRLLLPKAPIKKRDIILRECDVFCVQAPQKQKRDQITKISCSPRHLDVHKNPPPPPIKEASQKDEK